MSGVKTGLLALLLGLGATPAAAQTWIQCVARAPNGTLFVGEPSAGADRAQGARYRAEFIKAGRAGGGTEAEVGGETSFCFTAASEADLARLVAEAAKPCPTCQAPYTPKPVAWNIRDILPTELAASSTHLITLVMSEPPPPAPALDPAAPADPNAPPPEAAPPPPPPRPLASARWRTLLCGTEVRIAYGLETPEDSPVDSALFRARALAPQGGETLIETTLQKAASAPPTCASPTFVKLGELSDFLRDLPPRGDERLAALKQRLDDVTVMPAPAEPPPLPPAQVATAPAPPPANPPPPVAKAKPAPPVVATTAPARPEPSPIIKAATAPTPPPAPPPAPMPQAPPAVQEAATHALNAEINRKNAEVEARNAAATAAYEKRMAEFKAAQDAYEQAQRAHAAEVARAAADRAAWEAKVKACKAGDRAACGE